MTNKELIINLCKENQKQLEILTYEEVMKNVDGEDICSAEDFTGWEMNEGDTAYWFMNSQGYSYFEILKPGEDISDNELSRIKLFLDLF